MHEFMTAEPVDYHMVLAGKQKVLFLGMGGGMDVLSAMLVRASLMIPPAVTTLLGGIHRASLTAYRQLTIVNKSVAWAHAHSTRKKAGRFGEPALASVLGQPIVLLSQHRGAAGMAGDLNAFVQQEGIDLVIFVDGGFDSLLVGDENSLASLRSDQVSLAMASQLRCATLMANVGFGVEPEIAHHYVLRNIAALVQRQGFLGATGLSAHVAQSCLPIVDAVLAITRSSTVSSIRAALGGYFGPFDNPAWAHGQVFVSPLMLIAFFFDPQVVYAHSPLAQMIAATRSADEIDQALRQFREQRERGPRLEIPL
jgi:hypothetical protein